MDIFLWVPCLCAALPHHCFCFQELAEHFVPSGSLVKHASVRVWSSSPITPNIPYYLFEMSELRQQLSFCSQSSRGHVLPQKRFSLMLYNVNLKRWESRFWPLTVGLLFDHGGGWCVRLQPCVLLRRPWAACGTSLCSHFVTYFAFSSQLDGKISMKALNVECHVEVRGRVQCRVFIAPSKAPVKGPHQSIFDLSPLAETTSIYYKYC